MDVVIGFAQAADPGAAKELYLALDDVVRSPAPDLIKGGPDTVILALGSAGAITAAVEAFRLWLSRERRRHLVVSWTDSEQHHRIEVDGDRLSAAAARDVLIAALNRTRQQRNG